MHKNQVLGVGRFALILLAASVGSPRASAQTSDQGTVPPSQSQTPFQLKASSNLVVLRVVVRDAEGKPVAGLQKEDFKVLDRGKEQSISQFEAETSAPLSSAAAPPSTTVNAPPGQAAPPPPTATPAKFLALYFDDLNTSDTDMIYAREAAEHYLATNLQPKDRMAIFTSDKMLSDFTADPQQIHAALAKLQANARSMTRTHDCPDISDYQALEITQQENPESSDAWQKALDEAMSRCKMGTPTFGLAGESDEDPAKSQADARGHDSNDGAENVVSGANPGAIQFAATGSSGELHLTDARAAHHRSGVAGLPVAERAVSIRSNH